MVAIASPNYFLGVRSIADRPKSYNGRRSIERHPPTDPPSAAAMHTHDSPARPVGAVDRCSTPSSFNQPNRIACKTGFPSFSGGSSKQQRSVSLLPAFVAAACDDDSRTYARTARARARHDCGRALISGRTGGGKRDRSAYRRCVTNLTTVSHPSLNTNQT